MSNPYEVPTANLELETPELIYAGFWRRALASIIDSVLMALVFVPLLFLVYGEKLLDPNGYSETFLGVVLQYILPAIAVLLFWVYRSATPGKMLTSIVIVDAKTGGKPQVSQLVIRYVGYNVSMMVLFLGF